MKLKLQGPTLARALSKVMGGALVLCSHVHSFFFIKSLKVRFFNHNRLRITEVCRAVHINIKLFF